ncbi:phenylalanine--tRNA ligase subunit alpha [archaeon]|jgi:phenylalanyl-tRNA synthetase alpha chain|nr:phenylalanine--tRNA ligase subunit alpha [archaeon]
MKLLIESLHPLERKVVPVLKAKCTFEELEASLPNMQEVEITRALQWLENKKVLKTTTKLSEIVSIDENGKNAVKKGLPERILINSIKKDISLKELKTKSGLTNEEFNISLGVLRKKVAIILDKGNVNITTAGEKFKDSKSIESEFLKLLSEKVVKKDQLTDEQKFAFNELNSRKNLIKTDIIKSKSIELTSLGKKLIKEKLDFSNIIDTLTPAMLRNGSWKNKKFRRYDIKINVPKITPGKRHFINEAKDYAKQVWLDMGFQEMTGNMINTSFWNFDSLFVPQDHPAREMQDTFFLKGKGKIPAEFKDKIKKQHEKSWNYKWSEKEAEKLVLRTHTTVLSAKTISKLKKEDMPAKFFAIGKNFRNEALDWSHLFEFNQSEGIVVDPNANFKNLLGYLKQFFKKMGYDQVRFRPAYFPYTEPSVEIDVYLPERKTWVELGGAGILRPEVVEPLLGEYIPVLAWGFGLGRIVSPYYNIKDLREFYKNDIKQLKEMKSWL